MITYNIRLDETKPGSQCALQGVRVGEGGVRSINIILHSASVPVTIPADALAFLHCKKPDSTECVISTTVESSIIRIGVTQQMCASEGTVNCELKVYNSAQTQVLYSALFDIYVQETLSESGIVSSNEYSGLSDVMNGITYVFVKYSDNEPTQDSDMKDTAANWMGVYSGTSHTAPTAYTSYTWYERKGATGENGIKGDKGDKGDVGNPGTGNNWYVGTAISGTSLTPAVYPTDIPNALIGDMYLNNDELPDTGRAYVCTLGGNAATALWKYSCLLRGADGNGTGDMLTSTYDQDSDGIVDDSEKLGGNPSTWYQQATDGLSAEAAIVDEDTFPFYEASTSSHRKATWANIKAVLKTYFDALYTTALLKLTGYSKAASASAIATTDSINVAFGKLEKGLDDKAVPATDFLATLAVASWVGASAPYTQTVGGLTGVTSTSKLDVGLADTATDAQYAEAVVAQIRATGSDTGTVTFKAHGAKPTLALPIIVRMVN